MTSAKNIDLLSDVRSKAYLVWVSQVDAYLTEKFPYSAHLFKTTADERRVQIEWEVPGNEAADVDSRAARFVELQQHDEAAKAHVLQFLSPSLKQQFVSRPTGTAIWAQLKQHHDELMELEVENADELAPRLFNYSPMAAAAAAPSTDERVAALEAELRRMRATTAHPGGAGRPQAAVNRGGGAGDRRCWRCDEPGHLARNCIHPPVGAHPNRQGTCPRMSALTQMPWLLDSGATHHMSPGGALGPGAFIEYRALPQPFSVSFGKKGTAAPATGVGDVEVHGSLGTEVLTGVLHVPELAVSLFSVRAATDAQ